MADKHRVAFFLEDSAQEAIIPPLFSRLAEEEGLPPADLEFQVLYARGGASLEAFRIFLDDARDQPYLRSDLLVVGSDANCKGFTSRRDTVTAMAAKFPSQEFVTAIPDPHVERWYMLDLHALSQAAGVPLAVSPPPYKCDKNYYKTLLRHAFRGTEVTPPLGGIEYGPLVAKSMDLYQAAKQDHGLADFIDKTRAWLKCHKPVA
jgi:hypothetical protein